MSKKGLLLVYDPHNLYQFIWYYCNEGKKKRWDALCLPNGYKGEYMHEFCERSGIFESIYKNDTDFSTLPAKEKVVRLLWMILFFLIGQKRKMCEKIVNEYVQLDQYDEIVVIASVGYVSGACVALSKKIKVIILEDGTGDYLDRKRFISKTKLLSSYAWEGFFLSIMGYCCPGWYVFKPEKNCIKYSSHPDKMLYTNYKEIRQLYSGENTDKDLFDILSKRIYPELSEYDFDHIDTVLFTEPFDDNVSNSGKYIARLEEYISKNYKYIAIKRHPREKTDYSFGNQIKVFEIDNAIPAEAFLPYIAGKKVIIPKTCSIVLYLQEYNISAIALFFKGLYEESIRNNTMFRPPTKETMLEYYEKYLPNKYVIEEI